MKNLIKYIIFNGDIVSLNNFNLELTNRSFRYGDALFETIHAYGTKTQFLPNHLNRLTRSMSILNLEVPASFSESDLESKIHKLLDRNKLYLGARIRLTVFRSGGGFYIPNTNISEYIIESEALSYNKYEINNKGLQIDIYNKIKKPINILSNHKSANSLLFVMAGNYIKENRLDDCIILNEKGGLCEFSSSNLFVVKNDKIYTPHLSSGCINGIMRNQIIQLAKQNNIKITETEIKPNALVQADEIFLTNSIKGIQWIAGFKQKRFFNNMANRLNDELNKIAFTNTNKLV